MERSTVRTSPILTFVAEYKRCTSAIDVRKGRVECSKGEVVRYCLLFGESSRGEEGSLGEREEERENAGLHIVSTAMQG